MLGPMQTQWVAALRSKEYPQGRYKMISSECGIEKFCCLGVAARCFGLQCDAFYLTNKSWETLGLKDNDGAFIFPEEMLQSTRMAITLYESLAEMNDKGKSFNEIADFIEAHPELVFTEEV